MEYFLLNLFMTTHKANVLIPYNFIIVLRFVIRYNSRLIIFFFIMCNIICKNAVKHIIMLTMSTFFSVYFQMFMLLSVKMKAILLTQMIALFFIAALDQIQAIQNILFNAVTKQFMMKI